MATNQDLMKSFILLNKFYVLKVKDMKIKEMPKIKVLSVALPLLQKGGMHEQKNLVLNIVRVDKNQTALRKVFGNSYINEHQSNYFVGEFTNEYSNIFKIPYKKSDSQSRFFTVQKLKLLKAGRPGCATNSTATSDRREYTTVHSTTFFSFVVSNRLIPSETLSRQTR